MTDFACRLATDSDLPAIAALIDRAIESLQAGYLSPAQIAASRSSMGLDRQLIHDGTYFVAESDATIVGCGGWSYRATLYGGDHSAAQRDARRLDPARDAARIRAMYTEPAFARRGVGRCLLAACEAAARAAGFRHAELMATLAGEPLYRASAYQPVEWLPNMARDGVAVPGVRMAKRL